MSTLQIVASEAAAGNLPVGSVFVTWSDLIPRVVLAFAKATQGVWPLPPLPEEEASALLTRYHDLMANIGEEYGRDSIWWYSWSLSKDRFHSSILADMELTARFEQACARGLPDRLVMLCPDPDLARALWDIAREHGVDTLVALGDRLLWSEFRLQMFLKSLVVGAKICGRMFLIKWRLKKIKTSVEQSKRADQRTILVTWIRIKNLLDSEPADDTFFGPLPKFLTGPGHSVVVFGDISDGIPPTQSSWVSDSPSPVVTAASFISTWALLRGFVRGSFSRLPIPQALKSEPHYLAPLVRRDFLVNRPSIVYGLLLESGLRRLAKDLLPTQIIHMYENNPWERICVRAAATMELRPQVTGYMHCAVLLSHTKFTITEKEKHVRPRPIKVICTGPKAREIMVQFGGHSPDEVVAGDALRHVYLESMQPRGRMNRPLRNLLVVLEGLPTMSHFVRFIYESLDGQETFRTVIRAHPAYNLDRIAHGAGLSTGDFKSIQISTEAHIMRDFEEADVVIYKGSTAAMEAGYLGIPLIHYQHPNLLTDDPLFETMSLKKVVATQKELVSAIQSFSSMDDGEFLRQRDDLRTYIGEYLRSPGPDCATYFSPDSNTISAGV